MTLISAIGLAAAPQRVVKVAVFPNVPAIFMDKQGEPYGFYVDMLRALEKRGIFYSLNFMFGLDEDTPELFEETMEFLKKTRAPIRSSYRPRASCASTATPRAAGTPSAGCAGRSRT